MYKIIIKKLMCIEIMYFFIVMFGVIYLEVNGKSKVILLNCDYKICWNVCCLGVIIF